MKPSESLTSACRHCRYYCPEGRRGGHCQQLNVEVHGYWKACSLALPPFSPNWESLEGIMAWQQKTLSEQSLDDVDAAEYTSTPKGEVPLSVPSGTGRG